MSTSVLLIANTNLLELNGLRNAISDSFVNDATVVATLQDKNGIDVVGETWPFMLNYVANSDGQYQAILSSALTLINDARYKLTIVAQGGGLDARWEQYIQAKNRS